MAVKKKKKKKIKFYFFFFLGFKAKKGGGGGGEKKVPAVLIRKKVLKKGLVLQNYVNKVLSTNDKSLLMINLSLIKAALVPSFFAFM